MKIRSSSWVLGAAACLAMSAISCGSRSTLEPIEEHANNGIATGGVSWFGQGGAAGHGQTYGNGGTATGLSSTYRSSGPIAGTRWGSGGSKPNGGSVSHYGGSRSTGGTWSAGGSKPMNSSRVGGATHKNTTVGGTGYGGAVHYGGTWHAGGTKYTTTTIAGTTSFHTLGGRSSIGGTSAFAGGPAGGISATGGSIATGGLSAIPWTSICKSGLTECVNDAGTACVDAQTDANNCGFCGNSCPTGWHCDAGQCRAPACAGTFAFGPAIFDMRSSSSSYLSTMVTADFNGDGLLDVAVGGYYDSVVTVRLGEHKGHFGSIARYKSNYAPSSLAAADFNKDGKLDLLSIHTADPKGITVLLGNGDGTFASGPLQSHPISRVAIGDLDGDKIVDLVTDASAYYGLQTLRGTGDGTFEAPLVYATDKYYSSFAVADLNGDSLLDVIAADANAGAVAVRLNKGSGMLGEEKGYPVGADTPVSLLLGDQDEDNDQDIMVVCNNPNVAVPMLNNGNGELSMGSPYSTAGATEATLGDLNRDGNLDLVLLEPDSSSSYATSVGVRLGLGKAAFAKENFYASTSNNASPHIGDFDENGLLDLAALDVDYGKFVTLSGNGDGSFTDAVRYPSTHCPYSVTLADVNNDGALDLFTASGSAAIDEYLGPVKSLLSPKAQYGTFATQIALTDIDGDALSDMVIRYDYSSTIGLLFGTGSGKFGSEISIEADWPRLVAIADMNHDGWQDLVSLDYQSYAIGVSYNLGGRKFADYQVIITTSYVYDFAVGDLNGDALPDIVMNTGTAFQVALADVHGTYSNPVSHALNGSTWLKLADVNEDGKLDAVVTTAYNTNAINVLYGQGTGSFATGPSYVQEQYAGALLVADANGDGHLDIVTAGSDSTVNLLTGTGDGKFLSEPDSGYLNWTYQGLALGDLNGDGWPDIVSADRSGSECAVNVMFGRCR